MIKYRADSERFYFLDHTPLQQVRYKLAFSTPFHLVERSDLPAEKRPAGQFRLLSTGCLYDQEGCMIKCSERIGGVGGDHVFPVNDRYKPVPNYSQILNKNNAPKKTFASWGRDSADHWEYLPGETLYIGNWMMQYGHFLLETLSRFWDLDSLSRHEHIAAHTFIFNRGKIDISPWQAYLLNCLGVSVDTVRFLEKKTLIQQVTVPDIAWIFNRKVNHLSKCVYEKIHRTHWKNGERRPCFVSRSQRGYYRISNLDEVEAVFKQLGFDIIYADKLPIQEQLEKYANCSILAGISGSGLHNSLFAPSDILVIELGDSRSQDSSICSQVAAVELMEQELLQIPYKEKKGGYDCQYLHEQVGDVLGALTKGGAYPVLYGHWNHKLIPVDESLQAVKAGPGHSSRASILEKIRENYALYDHGIPWKGQAAWKAGKIIGQYIEEAGLLARIDDDNGYRVRALAALDKYLNTHEDVGDYHDLFLAETAIAVIYMLDYFEHCLSRQEKKKLLKKLRELYDALWKMSASLSMFVQKTPERFAWNHSLIVHAVLGLCAIKLQMKKHEARLDKAIVWVEGYLTFGLTADGFCREGVFYAGFTRMPLLLFLLNLKKYHNIDFLNKPSLKNHWQFLIDEWHVGTKTFITRNDSPPICSTNVSALLMYAHLCQVPQAAHFWHFLVGDRGSRTYGNPRVDSNRNGSLVLNYLYCPDQFEPLDFKDYASPFRFYPDVGVVVGYSADKRKLKYSLQASPHFSSIHSQADHGHLYLYLYGDALLTDTEVGNNRASGSPSQSEGHNSLLINGEGMALAGKGWPTVSMMEHVEQRDGFHIVWMNLAPAYNTHYSRIQVTAYRRLFIAYLGVPSFFIVLDHVIPLIQGQSGQGKAEFCYRFHTHMDNQLGQIEKNGLRITAKHSKLDIMPFGLAWEGASVNEFDHSRSRYADCAFSAGQFLGGYVLFPYKSENSPVGLECLEHAVHCEFPDQSVRIELLEKESVKVSVEKNGLKETFDFCL